LITGALSGIGHVTADLFAEEGATVVAADINDQAGGAVVASIRQRNGVAHFVHADISEETDAERLAAPRVVPLGSAELLVFFEEVCRRIKIPVMLQDADFQGGRLAARLFVELAERCPNFPAVKLENVLPGERCAEIIRLSNGKIKVFYG